MRKPRVELLGYCVDGGVEGEGEFGLLKQKVG